MSTGTTAFINNQHQETNHMDIKTEPGHEKPGRKPVGAGGASIPEHLPDKLAIAFWIWLWATHTQKGEAFHDLDRQFVELKRRGFNCVRIEAFPSFIFADDGSLRGEVEFRNPVEPEFGINTPGGYWLGGHRVALLERLLLLFRLAEKHGVFVALTSWEYQHGHTADLVADDALRGEIQTLAKDVEKRARVLARKWEMLLAVLKRENFLKQIAYLEIHNEWTECDKQPAEEAIVYLSPRFPELLFCMDTDPRKPAGGYFDFNRISSTIKEMVAENTQVFDFHMYAGNIQDELMWDVTGLCNVHGKPSEEVDRIMAELEKDGTGLRRLMRPDFMPWREFKTHLRCNTAWGYGTYLFHNLDPDHWDEWMFANYPRYEERMRVYFKNTVQYCAHVGRQWKVPVVCDEGYIFWPPRNSRFEPSAVGRRMFEDIVEAMVENGFWGIMISTYAFPGEPLWEDHADWLLGLNRRIIAGERRQP